MFTNFLKNFFSKGTTADEVGPSGLPRDIENELYQERNNVDDFMTNKDLNNRNDFILNHHYDNEFQQMFEQMNNAFRSFFHEIPRIDFQYGFHDNNEENGNQESDGKTLREKMLKGDDHQDDFMVIPYEGNEKSHHHGFGHHPGSLFGRFFGFGNDFKRNDQQDVDFDDAIKDGTRSLDEILANQEPVQNESRDDTFFHPFLWDSLIPKEGDKQYRSSFHYSSTVKKYNPDGSVEVKSSRRDSKGNEEVTVTRSLGNQTHSLTNKKSSSGEEETKENFVNMDEADLEKFENQWKEKKSEHTEKLISRDDKPHGTNISDLLSTWWKPRL